MSIRGPSEIDTNGDSANGEAHPAKRRKFARRPLSCTECKRRKTKCSSLGVVPCEACNVRGKPEECRWEDWPSDTSPSQPISRNNPLSTYALASDVEILKRQVHELYGMIGHHEASGSRPEHQKSQIDTSDRRSFTHPAPAPASDRDVEDAVANLEHLAGRGADHIPRWPPRSHGISSKSVPRMSTSRIPHLLDPESKSNSLHDSIFQILPERSATHILAEAYLRGPIHSGWHILHSPTFRDELAEFLSLEPESQRTESDPAWISILLLTLSLGLMNLSPMEVQHLFPHYEVSDIDRLPSAFYQASQYALDLAICNTVPQIRHIQAVLIYYPILLHFGASAEQNNLATYSLNSAVYVAQLLGLDRMGEEESKAPISDRAFAKVPAIAAQMSRRLFHWLSFLDGTTWNRPCMWRLEIHNALTTALPRNLNDEDISSSNFVEKSIHEITHASIPRVASQMAKQVRRFSKLDLEHSGMTYAEVLQFDAELRGVLSQCPSPLEQRQVNWMQCCIFSSVHNRLLRIHRPFMARGYFDPAFEQSKLKSIECAKNIIAVQRILLDAPRLRPGFIRHWILGAAIVLTIDMVTSIDTFHPPVILAQKRLEICHALDIFKSYAHNDPRIEDITKCSRTIEALLAAVDQRQRLTLRTRRRVEGDLQAFFQRVVSVLAGASESSDSMTSPTTTHTSQSQPEIDTTMNAQLPPDFFSFDAGFSFDFDLFNSSLDGPGTNLNAEIISPPFDFSLFGMAVE